MGKSIVSFSEIEPGDIKHVSSTRVESGVRARRWRNTVKKRDALSSWRDACTSYSATIPTYLFDAIVAFGSKPWSTRDIGGSSWYNPESLAIERERKRISVRAQAK